MKKSDHFVLARIMLGALAWSLGGLGAAHAAIPVYAFMVKHTYPHDRAAFTQGLFFKDGFLYESTGLKGQSSIRKVQLETGKVLQKKELSEEYFGEGIAPAGADIVSLTWTSKVGFVFDAKTFKLKRRFSYPGEGWGLASNGTQLFMSDGTPAIRILDPVTLSEVRRIQVTAAGKPIPNLNEIEWVDGQLYANVWGSNVIARIDPSSGNVVGWIDLSGLADPNWKDMGPDDVLNGIAWDARQRRLFVTGKHWPKLFEIELVERTGPR